MESKRGLTNEDFKKICSSMRSGPRIDQAQIDSSGKLKSKKSDKNKKKRKYKDHPQKTGHQKTETTKVDSIYRDRAKERREGINSNDDTTDVRALIYSDSLTLNPLKNESDNSELKHFESNSSNFSQMICDLEDDDQPSIKRKLLLQKQQAKIVAENANIESNSLTDLTNFQASISQAKNPMAKKIQNAIFGEKTSSNLDYFTERRMAYVFPLSSLQSENDQNDEDDIYHDDILLENQPPTCIIRAREESCAANKWKNTSINALVIQKLSQIFCYLRHGYRNDSSNPASKPHKNSQPNDSIYDEIRVNNDKNKSIFSSSTKFKNNNYFGTFQTKNQEYLSLEENLPLDTDCETPSKHRNLVSSEESGSENQKSEKKIRKKQEESYFEPYN